MNTPPTPLQTAIAAALNSELFMLVFSFSVLLLVFGLLMLPLARAEKKNKSPFAYPYWQHKFDVSGKRKADLNELIRTFISDEANWKEIKEHHKSVIQWKQYQQEYVNSVPKEKKRNRLQEQLNRAIDDAKEYCFLTIRNYRRYNSYQEQTDDYIYVTYEQLKMMRNKVPTLTKPAATRNVSQAHITKQRSLMTPELRKQIMERDNYTCQKCGRYMPDGFGLEIDHIVPVSKGGETVPWNLQVLCCDCNRKKNAKIE